MMPKINKNIIIGIAIVAILFFAGIIGWTLFQREKVLIPEEIITEEVYSLSGIVSKVDTKNNFLMVRPTGEESEVKVIITEDTKLFKILYSSERGNPEFVTERVEITIEDIKERDRVFIKTNINIAGIKEFNDVDYIEVL